MPDSAIPTFASRWAQAVAVAGDRAFLVWESSAAAENVWTYREFDDVVRRVAASLLGAGVRRGDAVHIALTNSPAFVAVWLATVRMGAYLVPCDPRATAPEIAAQLRRTHAVAGIASARRVEAYREACREVGGTRMFVTDEDDTTLAPFAGDSTAVDGLPEPRPLDVAAVMFTSGTTSLPKGVVVTQANYAFAGDTMAAAADLTPDDRQLVALPLFHANAQYYSFASAISVGASVALLSGFSASRFLSQAAHHGATHASLFAAPMRMILARGATPRSDLRLRHVWYAQNVTAEQYESLASLFGCRPRQLYGMTETIAAVLTAPPEMPTPYSIGSPTDGCLVALASPVDGTEPAPGDEGELLVGGRRGIELFREYLDDPATTDGSFVDGWFHTGDMARRDVDGQYFFTGRRSDVLKVAGENVSLAEIEAVLAEHPSLFEAAVVARPDPIRDEVPVAYVVAHAGGPSPTADELAAWCAARLGPAKRPRDYVFVEELPRTSVGKIRKFLLQDANPASNPARSF